MDLKLVDVIAGNDGKQVKVMAVNHPSFRRLFLGLLVQGDTKIFEIIFSLASRFDTPNLYLCSCKHKTRNYGTDYNQYPDFGLDNGGDRRLALDAEER